MVSQLFVVLVKSLNEFPYLFFEVITFTTLYLLRLDQYRSNLLKYMPKYIIIYSCIALQSSFVLDKNSFVVLFQMLTEKLCSELCREDAHSLVPTNFHMIEIPALWLIGWENAIFCQCTWKPSWSLKWTTRYSIVTLSISYSSFCQLNW